MGKKLKNEVISVVIPAYNASDYIDVAIQSVLEQQPSPRPFDIEIIIVDDNSDDNTVSFIKQNFDISFIQVITLDENQGPANARNIGIRASKGKYIALLDADDNFCPEKLYRQYKYLESNKDIDLVITGHQMLDENGCHLKNFRYNMPQSKQGQAKAVFLNKIPSFTPTLFFRKKIFTEVSGFDDNLTHLEDYEFLLKAIKKGDIGYIDELLTNRILHREGMSLSVDEKLYLETRKDFEIKAYHIFPELQNFKNEFWSGNFFGLGKLLLRRNNRSKARNYFIKSIKKRIHYKSFVGLFLSFTPSALVKKMLH